jgi:hypothetical protein
MRFTWPGKSSTRVVRPNYVAEMRQEVACYKRLRQLVNEWVDLQVTRERAEREKERGASGHFSQGAWALRRVISHSRCTT